MNYTEQLHWILDKDCKPGYNEENVQQNIDFVHSLELKCDCVGWSKLDLNSPDADDILEKIHIFCKENRWRARGYYTREFAEAESDWYAIRFTDTKENFVCDHMDVPSDNGQTARVFTIKAYQEMNISPKEWNEYRLVPERFRDACLRIGIDNVDFCWARDKGKYQAEQYFHLYPKQQVPHLAKDCQFHYSVQGLKRFDPRLKKQLVVLGGFLPKLGEIFYDLHIELPTCYLRSELPEGGIASAYIPGTFWSGGHQNILIHKDISALLLREKALSPCMLQPVPVLDTFPAGYHVFENGCQPQPSRLFTDKMLQEYEMLKSTPRPVRMVSEKEALKILRKAKKEHREDFQKGMPKAKAAESDQSYSQLVPYYLIANGGYLSDEYELLSCDRARSENAEWRKCLQSEELLSEVPDGIAIAKCPDGDMLLLCKNGMVTRFSHEAPEIVSQWPSLAQFVVDALNDSE